MRPDLLTTICSMNSLTRGNRHVEHRDLDSYALPCIVGEPIPLRTMGEEPRSMVEGGFWCRVGEAHPGNDSDKLLPLLR